jgi:F0F1-type ATP synthase assembly protein I
MSERKEPKYGRAIDLADRASLGISIVVAIVLGFAVGYGLFKLSGWWWFLPIGAVWGVGAAIYNVYKAYQKQKREFDELANEPRYKYKRPSKDDDDDY